MADSGEFRRILVPLDGSKTAEAAVGPAATLAAATGGTVTLFHVLERRAPGAVHGERHLREPGEAQTYLDGVIADVQARGARVEAHLHRNPAGDVAGEILDHAEELSADLVALATHGRGGLRDLLFGSIAQQVLRRGTVPVLIVRPGAPDMADWRPRRILVPLDARPAAEAALRPACGLARTFAGELRLVAVVPTAGTVPGDTAAAAALLPTATAGVLELEAQSTGDYLTRTLSGLWADGIDATAEVRRGDPVQTLAQAATEWNADLTILATRGRAGIDALLSASVGARLVTLLRHPALMLRLA